jgi:hypothetical protein
LPNRAAPWLAAAFALACASPLVPRAPAIPAPDPYLAELVAAARERALADQRGWHALLYYQPDTLGRGVTSLADTPEFFLAPAGKTDPQAELEATLASFFEPPAGGDEPEHPQCRYPARFHWLDAQLGLDPARLPRRDCPRLAVFRQDLGPVHGVSLIFPEAYMNNPASMFGHTLLRLDAAPWEEREPARDLLAYAVNFAAETGNDGGALFAVKGLVGSYTGTFSIAPYYDKVKQYGDWESRDIWEYRLDLTPEEVELLILHVYEMRTVGFDYYFFSENCSFALLGLIEVARPELDLRGRFHGWAIPADTLREVFRETGLAHSVVFRPSSDTRLRSLAARLSPEEQRLARELAHGGLAPDAPAVAALPDVTRALVLTVAYDELRRDATVEVAAERRAPSLALLQARSRVPVKGEPGPPPPTPAVQPHEGHETARVRFGGGWRDGRFFVEGRLRPAFHDLLDPLGGYTPGAQIDFLDVALRWYPDGDDLELHELTLVDIVSIAPRDVLFRPISWKFSTRAVRRLAPRDDGELRESYFWRTNGGAGLATQLGPHALAYGILESTADVSGALDPEWAVGAGVTAGLFLGDPSDRWRAHLHAGAMGFVLGDSHLALSAGLDQRLRLGRNLALELTFGVQREFDETWSEVGLYLRRYF